MMWWNKPPPPAAPGLVELVGRVLRPGFACIHKRIRAVHRARNLALALDKLHRQTLRCVPCDVAMRDPGPRVVGLEGHGEVAVSWKRRDVSARWVDEVDGCGGSVEYSCALSDDEHVVAVEMDWVGNSEGVWLADG
jgi:hypothetical protein